MEGKKGNGYSSSSSSSSSFTSDLFGSKESSSSSSSGIFGSIFAPTSKVIEREALRSGTEGKKQDYTNEAWNAKPGPPGDGSKYSGGGNQGTHNRDMSSIYQEQKVQPCHLSSSIYYGGQDIYNHPQNSQSTGVNSVFKKDGTDDDAGSASRGNWWQGSLYY